MTTLKVIHIEPTNKCQLSCSCCGDNKTRPIGFMGVADYHKIASQVCEMNMRAGIRLFLSGDPLLHPKIDEICKLTKSMGLDDTVIHTNGYALSEDLSERLVVSGLQRISFSLDSYHIAKNDKGRMMGWTPAKNVKKFIEINQKHNSPVHVTIQAILSKGWSENSYKSVCKQHFDGADRMYVIRPHSWDRKGRVEGAFRSNVGVCKFLVIEQLFVGMGMQWFAAPI